MPPASKTSLCPDDDVEIEQDPAFQKWEWRLQRMAWVAFALIILAAFSGTFGNGPLSNASASAPGAGLRLEYQRIARWGTPHTLTIDVDADEQRAMTAIVIWISRDYLKAMEIDSITPQPAAELLGADRIEFEFRSAASAGQTRSVTFSLRPVERGRVTGSIGMSGGPPVQFSQFIMP